MRSGLFTNTDEARNRGPEEGKAPLHAPLLFIGVDEVEVGQLTGIEDIGGDQEGRLAPHGAGEGRVIERGGRLDLPLQMVRSRLAPRTTAPAILGMRDDTAVHLEPIRALLELLGEGGAGICLAREATVAQMPQLLLPRLTRLLRLTGQCGPRALLARCSADDHPPLPIGG